MLKTAHAFSLSFAAALAMSAAAKAAPKDLDEKPIVFEARSGETVEAFQGSFKVPENRSDKNSRMIEIGYVRFPATGETPGAPIVYLAGGPGGTGVGTAKRQRFPLFMAMREFGDVIAYDQRGTGLSNDTLKCTSSVSIARDRLLSREDIVTLLSASVDECEEFWRAEGVDPAGYTTVESARDLEALREHLGAEKLSLWGISYGTHLALAAMKEMGPRIDRMVMASAEGLAQTVKLPMRTDAYFERLQEAFNADEDAPVIDIIGLMRSVHAALEAEPVMLELKPSKGETAPFLLTKEVMQRLASRTISDPRNATRLIPVYSAAAAGDFEPAEKVLSRLVTPGEPVSWRVMPLTMDVASGIDKARLSAVNSQAETSLLGDILNFPMPHLHGAMGLDLGDDFRTAPVSDIPVLLLTGTLDGRTYPDSQQQAFAGFSELTTVTIENAGHNLFMVSPDVTTTIQRFMRGELNGDETLTIAPPALPQRDE